DWSSDVCSSDLYAGLQIRGFADQGGGDRREVRPQGLEAVVLAAGFFARGESHQNATILRAKSIARQRQQSDGHRSRRCLRIDASPAVDAPVLLDRVERIERVIGRRRDYIEVCGQQQGVVAI